jgi:DNA-binding transcriptional LysR family regulator
VLVEEGDLTRLLPKLRLGELDLFVGRLEPGYAAPDLETEALLAEPMTAVVRPGHPLAAKRRLNWADLAKERCVMPPPWASLRVKLDQMFFRDGVHPPADIIESASFLAQISFLQKRDAVAFMARSVARHFQQQGMLQVLSLKVPIELPPVGLITMRARRRTPSTQQLIECLRRAAKARPER